MNTLALIAITWIGKEYRFLGLDWSYLMVLGFIGNALFSMRFLVQWVASERQGESVIPVSFWYLEHCRERPHVRLLHFPSRSDWNPGVSPKLADLHSQFDADPKAQVCFHCRRAFAASPRDGLTELFPGLFRILRFEFRSFPRR